MGLVPSWPVNSSKPPAKPPLTSTFSPQRDNENHDCLFNNYYALCPRHLAGRFSCIFHSSIVKAALSLSPFYRQRD